MKMGQQILLIDFELLLAASLDDVVNELQNNNVICNICHHIYIVAFSFN